jgi:peptidoglycan hydrolase-like protein with peptidoglycan-binding domain
MKNINNTVGEKGANAPDDVFMVQMLLNQVPAQEGGPNPQLNVDGLVGPKTIAAIRKFQRSQLGFEDGIVEPGKKTITRLNAFFQQPTAFQDTAPTLVASTGAISGFSVHRLVYRDVRLLGWRPKGDTVIEVNFDTPLQWFIDSSSDVANKNSNAVRLKLMAHGYTGPGGSQGGGGIQFCREDLSLSNLDRLRPLYGKFMAGVDVYACGVAYITPGYEGKVGDGNVFCSRMAQILGTHVRASTATQYYGLGSASSGLEFGRWEGTVLTYGPRGDVVNVEHAPPF